MFVVVVACQLQFVNGSEGRCKQLVRSVAAGPVRVKETGEQKKKQKNLFFSFFPYPILSLSAPVSEKGMRDEVFFDLRPGQMHKIGQKNKCRKTFPLFSHCTTSSSNERTIFRNKKRPDTLSYYISSIGKLQILIGNKIYRMDLEEERFFSVYGLNREEPLPKFGGNHSAIFRQGLFFFFPLRR